MEFSWRFYPKGDWGKNMSPPPCKETFVAIRRMVSGLLLQRGYQLAFVTPMRRPWAASSRNLIRESPQKRYTEWLRPVTVHRFVTRTRELFRGNLWSCWRILERTSRESVKSWARLVNRILSNSCLWNRALFFLSRCIELDITEFVIWRCLGFKKLHDGVPKMHFWNSFPKSILEKRGGLRDKGVETLRCHVVGAEKGTRTLDTCLGKAILYHWAISAGGPFYTKSPVEILGLFLPLPKRDFWKILNMGHFNNFF